MYFQMFSTNLFLQTDLYKFIELRPLLLMKSPKEYRVIHFY